jgi:membrane-associated protease RseP (regulator of RpoE activity)
LQYESSREQQGRMSGGDGARAPFPRIFPPPYFRPSPYSLLAPPRRRGSLLLAAALFFLTVLTTLAVGAEFALAYSESRAPFAGGFDFYLEIWRQPGLLLLGVPFSFTLMGILLAHELGHYFACRYYGIAASYPYFIPAPTIIGTMGAFIRIRSPIVNRKALFDVGIAGPVVGFLFAAPALAIAMASSKIVPAARLDSLVVFGEPLLSRLLAVVLHPGVRHADIFLHPVGRAAWAGLFATALNLIPVGQLDGGHILYAIASEKHRRISLLFVLLLIPVGIFFWRGWLVWAALLLLIGFRHPALVDRFEPLDAGRRAWALIALLIFILCFMPMPLDAVH